MLKNDGRRNGFLATCPLLSVSSPDLLGGNFQNRSCWLAEKPYQALEILCGCSQEELLAHKLQSPQAEATQPDLILQFGEQRFHFLSLSLGASKLWCVGQFPGALPGWFVLVNDKATESSAGAL